MTLAETILSMNKIFIIVKREFTYRVTKRSFLVLTLLMPFLFAAVVFVPLMLSSVRDNTQKNVVVIDRTGKYAPLFKTDGHFRFVMSDSMKEEYRNPDGDTYAVVSIWDNLAEHPEAVRIYSTREIPAELKQFVNSLLDKKVRDDRLNSYGIPNLKMIIDRCNEDFDVQTVKWTEHGSENVSDTSVAMGVGLFFTFLIYMFVLSYGAMVMQSVMEEKTNRVMEIMVSSVKPFTLMMGKIIGVALVGLFQLLIWGILVGVIVSVASALFGVPAEPVPDVAGTVPAVAGEVSHAGDLLSVLGGMNFAEIIVMFLFCFVGGYLFYASFFAAMGSAVNSHEDSSQFMMPMVIVMLFAFYAGIYSAENPDGPLAFWCSMFPLTSPIVMMVRLPFGVPLWQEVLSLVLLYGAALSMIWAAGKVYRVGVLMYGKKPSLREIIRWINYK